MKLGTLLFIVGIIVVFSLIIRAFSKNNFEQISSFVPVEEVKTSLNLELKPRRVLKPNEQFVGAVAMYIQVPENMRFRKEDVGNDPGRPVDASFFIEEGSKENPAYQLYGLVQKNGSKALLEQAKKSMDFATVKEITVGGYSGIEGLVTGPKARYLTVIIKGDKIISFSTIPYTQENKKITGKILSTISFQ